MKRRYSFRIPGPMGLAVVLAAVVSLSCCGGGAPGLGPAKKITVVQSSVSLGDPHICSDSANRLSLIFSVRYQISMGPSASRSIISISFLT